MCLFLPQEALPLLLQKTAAAATPGDYVVGGPGSAGCVIAACLVEKKENKNEIPLKKEVDTYKAYGLDGIEDGAINQMDTAMRLPITVKGALMPDAHQGYGLPIGGVLATENAVIPYGVGMDIGCRMCLSIYDLSHIGI